MSLKVKKEELISYKFYKDLVELKYSTLDHIYYLVNNEELIPLDSVTQVVKIVDKSAVLINWAVKLTADRILNSVHLPISDEEFRGIVLEAKSAHREKLEEAANIGKQAHAWIEEYIKEQLFGGILIYRPFPEDERVKSCCHAALVWMTAHNVRWVCTEKKIYSQMYGYAGTLDGIAIVDSCHDPRCCPREFKNHRSLIDWKSSNQLYDEYLFQTAAYESAIEEETGEEILDRWIIRLGKDKGEVETWYFGPETFQEDFNAFLSCLTLTKAVRSVKLRMKEYKGLKKGERKCRKRKSQ